MRLVLISTIAMAACAPSEANTNATAQEAPVVTEIKNAGSANAAAGQPVQTAAGTREERVAQLLFAMVEASASRDWAAAQAAFPGARWEPRTSDTSQTSTINGQTFPTTQSVTGSTDVLPGTITLGRVRYDIVINGSRERVHAISINSPEGAVDDKAAVRRALETRGARWQSLGCIGFAMEIVRVGAGSASALVDFSVNHGSRVEPSVYYTIEMETPPETGDLDRCEG